MAEAKKYLAQMIDVVAKEEGNLYYDFTINGDIVFCREAYTGAEAVLKHCDGVGAILGNYLKIADVLRVEVHGSPEELKKVEGTLAGLNPEYFFFECGVVR